MRQHSADTVFGAHGMTLIMLFPVSASPSLTMLASSPHRLRRRCGGRSSSSPAARRSWSAATGASRRTAATTTCSGSGRGGSSRTASMPRCAPSSMNGEAIGVDCRVRAMSRGVALGQDENSVLNCLPYSSGAQCSCKVNIFASAQGLSRREASLLVCVSVPNRRRAHTRPCLTVHCALRSCCPTTGSWTAGQPSTCLRRRRTRQPSPCTSSRQRHDRGDNSTAAAAAARTAPQVAAQQRAIGAFAAATWLAVWLLSLGARACMSVTQQCLMVRLRRSLAVADAQCDALAAAMLRQGCALHKYVMQ